MDKVIRDGKVAVLYSPGYGTGWSTWGSGDTDELRQMPIFHPKLIAMVESGNSEGITDDWLIENIPELGGFYTGGKGSLKIEWVKQGDSFYIEEYDGSESVIVGSKDMIKA